MPPASRTGAPAAGRSGQTAVALGMAAAPLVSLVVVPLALLLVYRRQDAGPSSRRDGFDSHTGYLAKWWNWKTRDAQNVEP